MSVGLTSGCTRNIGDACTLSTDCSVSGDRLCDTTEPGGYCTVFNCEPNSCPNDSVCVLFADDTCSAATQTIRFRRTFCMATCNSDDDCRAGYRCLDITGEPGRSIVDQSPISATVCIVPQTTASDLPTEEPAVCRAAPPPAEGGVFSAAPSVDASLDHGAPLDGPAESRLLDDAAEGATLDVAAADASPP